MAKAHNPDLEPLDLAAISARIDELGKETDGPMFSRGDIYILLLWLTAFVAGITFLVWLRSDFGLLLSRIAIWGGFLVGFVLMLWRNRDIAVNPNPSFAAKMDDDHVAFRKLDAWLRRYPAEERQRLFRFVKLRRAILLRQTGALVGGFRHLGLLPVLVALYLQFRGAGEAGWSHFTQGNWATQVLLALILGMYIISTVASRLQRRAEMIEMVLDESLQPND